MFDAKADYKNRTSCYDMDNKRCPEMEFISGWLSIDTNDMYNGLMRWIVIVLITRKSFETLLNNPYTKDHQGGSFGDYLLKKKSCSVMIVFPTIESLV